ncbi:MAG: rhodanese-like domain-containing protein [Thiotrichales bacterium]|nr:MAG: rhodanese-like domain-containing protein [Thiotrichales bacterium]
MEQLIEFAGNHLFLVGALVAVLALLVKAEYDHQSGKANQVDPTAAIRLMNDDAVVVDVREAADFNKGHIKNAKNIPISTLKQQVDSVSAAKDSPVLMYCRTGNVSGKACRILKNSGFSDVHNLAGGIAGWQDANLPLTKK